MKNYLKIIKKAKTIALFSHNSPDPDTVGSTLGLYNALVKMGKSVDLFCETEDLKKFEFIEEAKLYNSKEFIAENYDLLIAIDIARLNMLGKYEDAFSSHKNTLRLDHHTKDEPVACVDIVKVYSACAILIYEVVKALKVKIDSKIATALYFAICGDTGIFRNNNTDSLTFRISAELLDKGAEIRKIYAEFFDKKTVPYIKLTSNVILNADINDEFGYVVMSASKDDFEKFGISYEESLGNIANTYLNCGYKVSAFLKEKQDGIYGSFRSKFEYDCSEIAAKFGGGGHKNASGFLIEKPLSEAIKDVHEAIKEYLENYNK